MNLTNSDAAFVSTNSVCQGIQVSALWSVIFAENVNISFAYQSFKWSNLASYNAGVTVSIIGLTKKSKKRTLYSINAKEEIEAKEVDNINAYLVPGDNLFISKANKPNDDKFPMQFGNHPYYANELMLDSVEARNLKFKKSINNNFIRPLYGSRECITDRPRYCVWLSDDEKELAYKNDVLKQRIEQVRKARASKTKDKQAQKLIDYPYRFRDQHVAKKKLLVIPIVSSENRDYLPVNLKASDAIIHNKAFAMYDAPLWNMALIASRLHLIWIGTVCVRLEMRFSYSNTLGWNTFPLPTLTQKNKEDLTTTAEEILIARERHFPATIADLYDPEKMPKDLRLAHERNDEVLERIYIGRKFKNDTERLEKLFELYTKMTAKK